ncbi:MAG: transposase [Herminiimonas sp.]|nr:transposase [Herminiimonas sp.]
MESRNLINVIVDARYSEQRLPRYRNNPLIAALPPCLDDIELTNALMQSPEFHAEQRNWQIHERMQLVAGLSSFMVPLERHVQLARTLDVLMREGYVGREPRTIQHTQMFQKIYDNQKAGKAFQMSRTSATPQLSTSLIGISGVGKSTTVERVLAMTPQVIHHPDLGVWQIPYLHIETPHDGVSVKGLAHSILRKVDALIPDANYYETYAMRGKPSVETLMNHVARVMHIHCVGLLVCDEIQNLENAPKNKQSLMTLLVSASNELRVPIMFIGTNKARRVLGLDFRQARRSVGKGSAYWDRLTQGSPEEPGEWDDFLGVLWRFQWIQRPAELNPHLSDVMYHYSQGIIDIAIKLFAACQWRAMMDGSETITVQLIDAVAKKELSMVMPMVEALRNNNLKALEAYDDIAPLGFEDMLRNVESQYVGKRLRGASTRPGDSNFAPSVTTVLTHLGVESKQAEQIATAVEASGEVNNTLEGTALALKHLQPPARVKSKAIKLKAEPKLEPNDLRNAVRLAKSEGTRVFHQLQLMGVVCDLNKVLSV